MKSNAILKNIRWQNMYLILTIETGKAEPHFVLQKTYREVVKGRKPHGYIPGIIREMPFPFSYDFVNDEKTEISINVAQVVGRSFLDNGDYLLLEDSGDEPQMVCCEYKCVYSFDDASRIFRYGKGKAYKTEKDYNLSFTADNDYTDEKGELPFVIHSVFTKMDMKWRTNYEGIRRKFAPAINLYIGTKKRNGIHNVLFLTQTKDRLTGNLKMVADRFVERGLDKKYKVSYYSKNDVTTGLRIPDLLKIIQLVRESDVIFVDDYVPMLSYIQPPKGTQLIQLWHAGLGFKSVGYSRFGRKGSPHPETSCHRKYTMATVATEAEIEAYREVFGIERDAFFPCGMPRLDGFLDEDRIAAAREEIYNEHPELKGKKVIMFAPTFRGEGEQVAYYDFDILDQKKIVEMCGDEYIFMIKMHPFVRKKMKIEDYAKDAIVDFSSYPDINKLYYVTDLLITDYSSNYYEYALLGNPVLFFCYDLDEYQITRGVHRLVRDAAPGKVVETFDEMIESIKNKDFDQEKTESFRQEVLSRMRGNSTDAIINKVLGIK